MPIVSGGAPVPSMSQADKDALIARLTKIASVGGSLLSNATAAKKLALTIPTDSTAPPVVPASSTKRVVVWHHAWAGPRVYTGYPDAVKAVVDRVTLGVAQSAGAGTGRLGYSGVTANLPADIAAAKAAGVDVLMGIGGSNDGGVTCLNTTQAQQMVDSIVGFVDSYGINGIAFDLEDLSHWNVASLTFVAQALKAKYGAGFLVDVTAGYILGQSDVQYNALAQSLGPLMDTFSLMEYDYPQASTATYGSIVAAKVGKVIDAGVPASKIIFGQAVTDPANQGYAGYTRSVADALTAYQTVKTAYPDLGGAFIWEDKISAARTPAWDWVTGMAGTIHA